MHKTKHADTETNFVVTVGFTTKVDHQTTSKIWSFFRPQIIMILKVTAVAGIIINFLSYPSLSSLFVLSTALHNRNFKQWCTGVKMNDRERTFSGARRDKCTGEMFSSSGCVLTTV